MALIECDECANAVSDKAYDCPHCGFPLKQRPSGSSLLRFVDTVFDTLGGVLIFIVVLGILGMIVASFK